MGVLSEARTIIMNFAAPPSLDDIQILGQEALNLMPEELLEHCEEALIVVEDFPDEATEQELDLDDPYDLLALYRSGREISPGVERKTSNDDDVLTLYRRPILDLWCENCDNLTHLVRQIMIEEIGRYFEFSDDDIEEMVSRHYQGLL